MSATAELTYGIVGIPANLDPHNQVVPNDFATRVAFDSLLLPGGSGGLVPWLAESYENVDPVTWRFHLRRGVHFASGRPLTADAVVWNFERVAGSADLLGSARITTLERCRAVDGTTVEFRTAGPDVIWPRRVLQIVIMDPAEPMDGVTGRPSPDAGTGLFRIVEFEPGVMVRHEAVPDTWRGGPALAGLRMLPLDPTELLAGLCDGTVHLGYLSAERVGQAQRAGLVLQQVLQSNVHMIRFDSTSGPFSDRRLRTAVSAAVDLDGIVRDRYLGEGRAATQVVGADCFGYSRDLAAPVHDPRRAAELVQAAGHSGTLRMDILGSSAVLRPWGDAVVESLGGVGLAVEANYVQLPEYLGKLARNDPPRSELIGAGNQYGPGLDAEFSLNKFSSKLPAAQVEYDNPDFQQLYDASQIEFDPVRRGGLLRAATRVLLEDHGCVPVYQPALSWLISPLVTGLEMNSIGAGWIDWRNVTLAPSRD